MVHRQSLEFAYGIIISASFGLVFVASYLLFETLFTETKMALGLPTEVTIGWLYLLLVGALVATVVFNFLFSDIIRAKLDRYFSGNG